MNDHLQWPANRGNLKWCSHAFPRRQATTLRNSVIEIEGKFEEHRFLEQLYSVSRQKYFNQNFDKHDSKIASTYHVGQCLRTVPRIQNIVTRRLKAGIVYLVETSIVRQRLSQHIPVATNTQETIELVLKTMFSVQSASSKVTLTLTQTVLSVTEMRKGGWKAMVIQFSWGNNWEAVLNENRQRKDLDAGSWRISAVRSRCQGTAGEDTAGWKRLSGCCGDLWIVEISGGAVITDSS
jgi:hypothetical protein